MLDLKSFAHEDRGSSPGVSGYLVWNRGEWCDPVSSGSASVYPSLNKYLERSLKVNNKSVQKYGMADPQPLMALPG